MDNHEKARAEKKKQHTARGEQGGHVEAVASTVRIQKRGNDADRKTAKKSIVVRTIKSTGGGGRLRGKQTREKCY